MHNIPNRTSLIMRNIAYIEESIRNLLLKFGIYYKISLTKTQKILLTKHLVETFCISVVEIVNERKMVRTTIYKRFYKNISSQQ